MCKRLIKENGINIPLIVDVQTVNNHSENKLIPYQVFFDVSDIQIQHAIDYMYYWEILRICCGKQMSKHWRNYLQKKSYKGYKNSYIPCHEYDISEVENQFIKTYVYQHFSPIPSVHKIIGRPSNVDGDLDGTYCERCNKNIKIKSLKFNEDCS